MKSRSHRAVVVRMVTPRRPLRHSWNRGYVLHACPASPTHELTISLLKAMLSLSQTRISSGLVTGCAWWTDKATSCRDWRTLRQWLARRPRGKALPSVPSWLGGPRQSFLGSGAPVNSVCEGQQRDLREQFRRGGGDRLPRSDAEEAQRLRGPPCQVRLS